MEKPGIYLPRPERWPQFGLLGLLVLIALLAIPFAWEANRRQRLRQRTVLMAELVSERAGIGWDGQLAETLGEYKGVEPMTLILLPPKLEHRLEEVRAIFPEATVELRSQHKLVPRSPTDPAGPAKP